MPYVDQKTRQELNVRTDRDINTPGELNYAITMLCVRYVGDPATTSYQSINDALGALDGAAREFYHKVARPYEDRKEQENGTVYRT